jgi:hypothetical protein
LASEIHSAWRGMMIAIPSQNWSSFSRDLTARQLVNTLIAMAKNISLPTSLKHHLHHHNRGHIARGMHRRIFRPSDAQVDDADDAF